MFFFIVFAIILILNRYKSRQYNYRKEYTYSYGLVLTNTQKAFNRLEETITKCEEMKNDEFVCKFAILKLYVDLDTENNYFTSLRRINLNNILYKKGSFDDSKSTWNVDSLYFLSIDLIKAYHHHKQEIVETIYNQINEHATQLDKYLEFHLFNAIYSSLTKTSDYGVTFYNNLLTYEVSNSKYDNKSIEIYQSTALAMKRYIDQRLTTEEINRLDNFSKTLLGRIIINNL